MHFNVYLAPCFIFMSFLYVIIINRIGAGLNGSKVGMFDVTLPHYCRDPMFERKKVYSAYVFDYRRQPALFSCGL